MILVYIEYLSQNSNNGVQFPPIIFLVKTHLVYRYKKITYNYDLISGKVNQVSYQPCKPDAYYHRYEYDAENRLIQV